MLDAGRRFPLKAGDISEKNSFSNPVSGDQYPASIYYLKISLLQKFDINFKILVYVDS
jgi:hypothetical protein